MSQNTQYGSDIVGDIQSIYAGSGRGLALNTDGTVVAIGSPWDDNSGKSRNGEVEVWKNGGTGWVQLGSDLHNDSAPSLNHDSLGGYSISLNASGTRLAYGVHNNYGGANGYVRVYDWNASSSSWGSPTIISGDNNNDKFGRSVSMSDDGNRMAIGAYNANYVKMFEYSSGSWSAIGSNISVPDDGNPEDYVAMSGDGNTVIIGEYEYDQGGNSNIGKVRIFEWNSGTSDWVQKGSTITGDSSGDNFGYSVAINKDGTIIAAGAPMIGGNNGLVKLYQWNTSSWTQYGSTITGDNADDNFGFSIGLSENGKRILIGARQDDDGGTNSGRATLYEMRINDWQQVSQSIDGSQNDETLGWRSRISKDGLRFAISAPSYQISGKKRGRVAVYNAPVTGIYKDNALFTSFQFTKGPNGNTDRIGHSTAANYDGSIVAYGAIQYDSNKGKVSIYQRNGRTWTLIGELLGDTTSGNNFGASIALSKTGKRIAIEAPHYDSRRGTVFVYDYSGSGTTWTQLGSTTQLNQLKGDSSGDAGGTGTSGHGFDGGFHETVAMSDDGTRLALGRRYHDSSKGNVKIYDYDGSDWSQVGSDIDGEASSDMSGFAIALNSTGSRVAIGAPENDGNGADSGHVRVYDWDGSAWGQVGSDIDGESGSDKSGWNVSLDSVGNRIAIGGILNDGNGSNSGHVRVFDWDGSSWGQIGSDIDGEAEGDESGYSIQLSKDGNRLAIGSVYNDSNIGNSNGHIRVYEYISSNWVKKLKDFDGEASADLLGKYMSLSGDGKTLVGGAEQHNYTDGYAIVYTLKHTITSNGILLGPGESLTSSDDLTSVDLKGTNLRGMIFTGVDLTGADLTGADLTGSTLNGVNLTNTILTNALLGNISSSNITNSTGVTLPSNYSIVGGAITNSFNELEAIFSTNSLTNASLSSYTNNTPNNGRVILDTAKVQEVITTDVKNSSKAKRQLFMKTYFSTLQSRLDTNYSLRIAKEHLPMDGIIKNTDITTVEVVNPSSVVSMDTSEKNVAFYSPLVNLNDMVTINCFLDGHSVSITKKNTNYLVVKTNTEGSTEEYKEDGDTVQWGDALFIIGSVTSHYNPDVPCLLAGTKINTPYGNVKIENLTVSDYVISQDKRILSINHITKTHVVTNKENAPYLIPKNFFNKNTPVEDTWISPDHAILCDKKRNAWFIPRVHADSCGLKRYPLNEKITYYNITLPNWLSDHFIVSKSLVVESNGQDYHRKLKLEHPLYTVLNDGLYQRSVNDYFKQQSSMKKTGKGIICFQ